MCRVAISATWGAVIGDLEGAIETEVDIFSVTVGQSFQAPLVEGDLEDPFALEGVLRLQLGGQTAV